MESSHADSTLDTSGPSSNWCHDRMSSAESIAGASKRKELSDEEFVSSSERKDVLVSKSKKAKLLPPCRICGEKASGLHYGVNTCEACKGFFRRSITRGENFKCSENNDCQILPGKRNNCAACRFRKCVGLGMSKEAIKIGRYTHEKRTQDIIEVKQTANSSTTPDQIFSSNEKVLAECDTELSPRKSSDDMVICSKNNTAYEKMKTEYLMHPPSVYEQTITNSMSVIDEIHKYVKRLSKGLVHMKYFFAAKTPSELQGLVQRRLEETRIETDLLGDEVLPAKDYVKVMAETGIDLDSRKELLQNWAEGIEETFIVIAEFAKCVPGFRSLPIEDQIAVINATRSQLLFVASHKRFDEQHKCFIGRFNRVESFQDIVKIYNNKKFVLDMIALAGKFKKIRLTDLEWLVVLALIMTHPASMEVPLSDKARTILKVMYAQELKILEFYLKLNHPDKPDLFSLVNEACAETRKENVIHMQLVDEMREVWKDFLNFPPLFEEIMHIQFRQKIIPRKSPKSGSPPTCTMPKAGTPGKNQMQHWKKSTIAKILESSEMIELLMSAANKRSRSENVLSSNELKARHMDDSGKDYPSADCVSKYHPTSASLESKLNDCYGISFGDPLSPQCNTDDTFSGLFDENFTPVPLDVYTQEKINSMIQHNEAEAKPVINFSTGHSYMQHKSEPNVDSCQYKQPNVAFGLPQVKSSIHMLPHLVSSGQTTISSSSDLYSHPMSDYGPYHISTPNVQFTEQSAAGLSSFYHNSRVIHCDSGNSVSPPYYLPNRSSKGKTDSIYERMGSEGRNMANM